MTKVISIMSLGLSMSVIAHAEEHRDQMMDLQIYQDAGKGASKSKSQEFNKVDLRRHLNLHKAPSIFKRRRNL